MAVYFIGINRYVCRIRIVQDKISSDEFDSMTHN